MAITTVIPVLPAPIPIYARYEIPNTPPAPPTVVFKRVVAFGIEQSGSTVLYRPMTIENLLAGSGFADTMPNYAGVQTKFY